MGRAPFVVGTLGLSEAINRLLQTCSRYFRVVRGDKSPITNLFTKERAINRLLQTYLRRSEND